MRIFLEDHRIKKNSMTIFVRPIYPLLSWLQLRSFIKSFQIYVELRVILYIIIKLWIKQKKYHPIKRRLRHFVDVYSIHTIKCKGPKNYLAARSPGTLMRRCIYCVYPGRTLVSLSNIHILMRLIKFQQEMTFSNWKAPF